jgi:acyl carrier protein
MAGMDREDVMRLVRQHLSTELEVAPERIQPETRFREDLDADSLDLYELVMELEDRYGIRVSEEEAAEIETVGDAVDFVCARDARVLRSGSEGATR